MRMAMILLIVLLAGCTVKPETVCDYSITCNENSTTVCCKDIGLQPCGEKMVNLTILCQTSQPQQQNGNMQMIN